MTWRTVECGKKGVLAGDTRADDFQDTWVFGRTDGRWEVRAFHTCPA